MIKAFTKLDKKDHICELNDSTSLIFSIITKSPGLEIVIANK